MFPERFTVGHMVRSVSHDGMSEVESWADPVDVKIICWFPPGPDDIVRAEQTGTRHELNVLCKTPFTAHRDRLVINGVEWLVQGEPDDYMHGPFGFDAGYRIRCARLEG